MILSEEQAQAIFHSEHCNISKELAGILARAIEAAVLEAQGKQKPVAWVKYGVGVAPHFVPVVNGVVTFSCSITESLEYEPLYTAPVVQPDLDVIAEYTGQDGKREWKDVGAWLRPGEVIAVIAAAEGKK